jgi:2',3'-cyclic-nucleotide 2'-phosphodiesterase (5'-nucleotidase family)
MSCTPKVNHLADTHSRQYQIEPASQGVDPEVAQLIEPYRIKVSATMNEVIGYNETELVKEKPSSTLTNWFADAFHVQTALETGKHVDFAIQNYGGIRINALAAGDVTVGKIYELMPFDNLVYIMELDSQAVQMLCDKMVESKGWPVSFGLNMEISYGKATNIQIGNIALSSQRTYLAAIPDYIANGGDNFHFLRDMKYSNTGILIRDLLIRYVKSLTASGKKIIPNHDIRFK